MENENEIAQELNRLFYTIRMEHAPKGKKKVNMEHRDIMLLNGITQMNQGQPIKLSQISEYFHISLAAVSQGVRIFEKNGWIERVMVEHDRRSVYIQVTEAAKRHVQDRENEVNQQLINFIRYLGYEDSMALIRITEKAGQFLAETCHTEGNDRKGESQ